MKLYSLNSKHAKLLENYFKFVQHVAYDATEDYNSRKFDDFNEILVNIVHYANQFRKMVKNEDRIAEWAYMMPNLMLYSGVGFLCGVRNNRNSQEIDKLSARLYDETINLVGETSDILTDIRIRKDIKHKLLLKKIQKNEH